MKIHIDADSGIAGNMFLAACLDLGLDQKELVENLKTIQLAEWSLEVKQERSGGIAGLHLHVTIPPEKKHRHLPHILSLIETSQLPDPVKARSVAIFQTLAQAEGEAHGIGADKVHFHEVGAVDAIVDICGAAFAAWKLGFSDVTATAIPVGTGTVQCEHGRMPVPVPAVVNIFSRYHVPIKPDNVEMELVTPTGAAILVNLVDEFCAPRLTQIDLVGYGLGTRQLPGRSNALRLLAQQEESIKDNQIQREWVAVLSSNLDDMNPEWYGSLWQRLFDAGALDMALIPMTMKKGRPAVQLEVIAPLGKEEALANLILQHTTTLGVRVATTERLIQSRSSKTVATPWGEIRLKEAGGISAVEHDDLLKLAVSQGWSLPKAQQQIAPFMHTHTTLDNHKGD